MDNLDHLSQVLGFKFHDGSDKSLELKVVKNILIRETMVMKLSHMAATMSAESGSKILDVLMPLRDNTLTVIEAVVAWRNSMPSNNPLNPTPFDWEGRNYLLKLIDDTNFLAENPKFVQSIRLAPNKLIRNPLMLSNSLEEIQSIVDPFQLAGRDAGGKYYGAVFDERHRLRLAERVLLVEMECAAVINSKLEAQRMQKKVAAVSVQQRKKKKTPQMTKNPDLRSLNSLSTVSIDSTLAPPPPASAESAPPSRSQKQTSSQIQRSSSAKSTKFDLADNSVFFDPLPELPQLTASDLTTCVGVSNPPNNLQLAAAVCIILLAPGFEVRLLFP